MFPLARRRHLVRLGIVLSVTLAVGLLVAGLPASGGTLAGSTKIGSPQSRLLGPVQEVTLVTGDTLDVRRLPNGHYQASPSATSALRTVSNHVPVTFAQLTTPQGDLYVFPSDAMGQIARGELDKQLFNISGLIAQGYADKRTKKLPVIVQLGAQTADTRTALSETVDALPATDGALGLTSIHGAATDLMKANAERFWASVRQPANGTQSANDSVKHIWLDRRFHVALDQSAPQIGAPTAWAAGLDGTGVKIAMLDTGIDATHPDFAGRIAETANFSSENSVVDGHGHGTHTASIAAGSGAADGGRYRGIAPGAQLLIGKVCDSGGSCDDSSIIAGMEWATSHGARVVSMSLGSPFPGDGSDPMDQAVDQLTASTGALFVIAAGNSGPGPRTVSSPGSAASALTVGAVDKSDQLANFSSRGPLTRTVALKPDITAPGVHIIAARAAGTSMGDPVDDFYTSASGTSMATPHVTGAAAILAQEHPDWQAPQLKAALMESSDPQPGIHPVRAGRGTRRCRQGDQPAGHRHPCEPRLRRADLPGDGPGHEDADADQLRRR